MVWLRRLARAGVTAALLGAMSRASVATAGAQSLGGTLFVVDPGHGTVTSQGHFINVGAVGPDGVHETQVALSVGEDLARLLRSGGARVVLTRSFARPWRVGRVVRLDNRARAALANRLHATAFVSIHADASHDPRVGGSSVFWLRSNSVRLAEAIELRLRALDLGRSQLRRRDLAVTNEARVPAVLVEIGFLTNRSQERRLATRAFQLKAARALYSALVAVYGRVVPAGRKARS